MHRNHRNNVYYGRGLVSSYFNIGIDSATSDKRNHAMSAGAGWGTALYERGGATPRNQGEFFAIIDPSQPVVKYTGMVECLLGNCDITGMVQVNGPSPSGDKFDPLPAITIDMNNIKWATDCRHPDDTFPSAFFTCLNTHMKITGTCIKGEPTGLPRFGFYRNPNSQAGLGTFDCSQLTMETRNGKTLTPWTEALCNVMQAVQLDVRNPNNGFRTHGISTSGYASRTDGANIDPALIGADIEVKRLKGQAFALTTNPTPAVGAFLTHTPDAGSYDVYLNAIFIATGGVGAGAEVMIAPNNNITDTLAAAYGFTREAYGTVTPLTGNVFQVRAGPLRVVIADGNVTPINALARAATTAGSLTVYGNLNFKRVG